MLRPLFLGLLIACSSGPSAEAIRDAATAYRHSPSRDHLDQLAKVTHEGLAAGPRDEERQILLGDAAANLLLRPDLGLPLLEQHKRAAPDAYLDALLHAHALDRLASEHALLLDAPLDVAHPVAQAVASQAARSSSVGWRDLRDALEAARLVEAGLSWVRQELDRPVESHAELAAAAAVLGGEDPVAIAAARTRTPDDPDPLLTPGVVPCFGDRRRVVAYSRDGSDARAVGAALDAERSPRVNGLVAALGPPLSIETRHRGGVAWAFAASDAARAVAWIEASEALARGETPEAVRARYRERARGSAGTPRPGPR